MTTFRFDLSVPALLLTIPLLLVWSYVVYRGFARNQFKFPFGGRGWLTFPRGSFNYWSYTGMNLLMEAALLQCLYWSLFEGSRFFGK
jgi:hypothetical protein